MHITDADIGKTCLYRTHEVVVVGVGTTIPHQHVGLVKVHSLHSGRTWEVHQHELRPLETTETGPSACDTELNLLEHTLTEALRKAQERYTAILLERNVALGLLHHHGLMPEYQRRLSVLAPHHDDT